MCAEYQECYSELDYNNYRTFILSLTIFKNQDVEKIFYKRQQKF